MFIVEEVESLVVAVGEDLVENEIPATPTDKKFAEEFGDDQARAPAKVNLGLAFDSIFVSPGSAKRNRARMDSKA